MSECSGQEDGEQNDGYWNQPHETRQLTYEDRRHNKKVDGEELNSENGAGSGDAMDALIDQTTDDIDKETRARTTFDSREAGVLKSDGSRVSYNTLWEHHVGRHPITSNSDEYRSMDRDDHLFKLTATLTSQLELTPYQKKQTNEWVKQIQMDEKGQLSIEALVLATITFACNLDNRWIQREGIFKDVSDTLGVESSDLKSARKHLRPQFDI